MLGVINKCSNCSSHGSFSIGDKGQRLAETIFSDKGQRLAETILFLVTHEAPADKTPN